jgi:aspartyl-tRNA(Asn)/glutamyl-tRNA(Gln) amidotransferase subunit C
MSISREDVERVARLAHLEPSEAEIDRMTATLGAILDYMVVLAEAPALAAADAGAEAALPLRDDVPCPGLSPEEATAGAPGAAGPLFRVPPMLAGGDRP